MAPTDPRPPELVRRIADRRAALAADLERRLAGVGRLTLEFGCGHGHFLVAYAARHPGEACLGMDLIGERVTRAFRKAEAAGQARTWFLKAEAREFLAALPPGVSLGRVFVLFPDPWPKRRHHKNRLMGPAFLRAVAARTEPGSLLCFRSDHRGYAAEVARAVSATPEWEDAGVTAWPFEHETVFQKRAAGTGHASVVARRTAVAVASVAESPGEEDELGDDGSDHEHAGEGAERVERGRSGGPGVGRPFVAAISVPAVDDGGQVTGTHASQAGAGSAPAGD